MVKLNFINEKVRLKMVRFSPYLLVLSEIYHRKWNAVKCLYLLSSAVRWRKCYKLIGWNAWKRTLVKWLSKNLIKKYVWLEKCLLSLTFTCCALNQNANIQCCYKSIIYRVKQTLIFDFHWICPFIEMHGEKKVSCSLYINLV